MKIRHFMCLLLTLLMLVMVGCDAQKPPVEPDPSTPNAPSQEENDPDPAPKPENPSKPGADSSKNEPLPKNRPYKILFIGNSYTYYNDMPTVLFKQFAEAAGYTVEVTAITKGSHKLSQFADPTDTYGAKVEAALTGSTKYDFVVMQEQSLLPAGNEASAFFAAVRNLTQRILATGAEPVLYSTWGRKTGSSALTTNNLTNESMTWKVAASYQYIGDDLRLLVAHVGLAFFDVYKNQPFIDLYDSDYTHPSATGSYLAAATLFAKIFNTDPTTVNYTAGITEEQAGILRTAAKNAVFATPEIPKEYKVVSG